MQRINTFAFYMLGKNINPIDALVEEDTTYGAVFLILHYARMHAQFLLNNPILAVRTSKQACSEFIVAISNIVPAEIADIISKDKDAHVDSWDLRQIKIAATKLETILSEELNIADIYSILQKGIYSTNDLVNNAESMLTEDIRQKIPFGAIQDIREAGKCLTFELPTAAAFHASRAVEAVLLEYFKTIVSKPPPSRMRNWGLYIKLIRDSGGADEKIVKLLEYIKDSYRNPVSHPEAMLSVNEVLVFFGVANAAITQMAAKLP